MTQLQLKELVLLQGEQVAYHVEGNAYTDSPNPLTKLFVGIIRLFWMLLGIKLITYVIATNFRLIRIDKKTIFWGMIPSDISVVTINKNSVQSVGYSSAVRWLIFKTSYFTLQNITETIRITYKGDHSDLPQIVAEFSRLVTQ